MNDRKFLGLEVLKTSRDKSVNKKGFKMNFESLFLLRTCIFET